MTTHLYDTLYNLREQVYQAHDRIANIYWSDDIAYHFRELGIIHKEAEAILQKYNDKLNEVLKQNKQP
jgi:hypothetical protein